MIEIKFLINMWVIGIQDEFIQMKENFIYKKVKCYYYNECIKIKIMVIRFDYFKDYVIILFVINFFCIIKSIVFNSLDNCSYRMIDIREC